MKKIFIWLDDERKVPNQWLKRIEEGNLELAIFRKAEDLIQWYEENQGRYDRIFISFDHDLGTEMTGYSVAARIAEFHWQLDGYSIHSMNPVGRKHIFQLLDRFGYYNMKYTLDILN